MFSKRFQSRAHFPLCMATNRGSEESACYRVCYNVLNPDKVLTLSFGHLSFEPKCQRCC